MWKNKNLHLLCANISEAISQKRMLTVSPVTVLNIKLCSLLERHGFIRGYFVQGKDKGFTRRLVILLSYNQGSPNFLKIKPVTKSHSLTRKKNSNLILNSRGSVLIMSSSYLGLWFYTRSVESTSWTSVNTPTTDTFLDIQQSKKMGKPVVCLYF